MDPIVEVTRDPSQLANNPVLLGVTTAIVTQQWKERSAFLRRHRLLIPFIQFFTAILLGAFASFVFLSANPLEDWHRYINAWVGGGGIAQIGYTLAKMAGYAPTTNQIEEKANPTPSVPIPAPVPSPLPVTPPTPTPFTPPPSGPPVGPIPDRIEKPPFVPRG